MAGQFDDILGITESTKAPAPTSVGQFDDILGLRPKGGFIASAKQSIGSTIKGAGQLAADVAPGVVSQDNALKQYGQEVIDANPTAVQGFKDIVANPGKTLTEATGNAAGSLGGMLGLRALGTGITAAAPLAGPAAPVVAGLGQLVSWAGPAAVASLPSYGGIREKQMVNAPEAQTSAKDKAIAALGAATVGLIETKFGPQDWALTLAKKGGLEKLAGTVATTGFAKSIGKGAVKGGAIEGAEELVQSPVEQLASGDNPTTKESLTDTAFSGTMGAVGGGALGGAMGPMLRQKETDPTTEKVQAELLNNLTDDSTTVTVEDGTATLTKITPAGTMTIEATPEVIAKHLAEGKDIEELPAEKVEPTDEALSQGLDIGPEPVPQVDPRIATTLGKIKTADAATLAEMKASMPAFIEANPEFSAYRQTFLQEMYGRERELAGAPERTAVNIITGDVDGQPALQPDQGASPVEAGPVQLAEAEQVSEEVPQEAAPTLEPVAAVPEQAVAPPVAESVEAVVPGTPKPIMAFSGIEAVLNDGSRTILSPSIPGEFFDGDGNIVDENVVKQWRNVGDTQWNSIAGGKSTSSGVAFNPSPEPQPQETQNAEVQGPTPAEEVGQNTSQASVASPPREVTSEPTLPKDLSGAKPRYSYGDKKFLPVFASDLDRAAYIATQKAKSKRDADYVAWAEKNHGLTPEQLIAHGERVRAQMKKAATAMVGGTAKAPEKMPVAKVKHQTRKGKAEKPLLSQAAPKEQSPIEQFLATMTPSAQPRPLTELVKLIEAEGLSEQVKAKMEKVTGKPIESLAKGAVRLGRNTFKNIVESVVAEQRGGVVDTSAQTARVEKELRTFLGRGYDNLLRKGKMAIVQNMEALPANIRGFLKSDPIYAKDGGIAGAYDPKTGKVWLVADQIKSGEAKWVALHEGVHALLREDAVFSAKREKILADFERLATTNASVQAAMARVPADTPANLRVEEGLAYWAQNADNHNHSLFKRIISAIKSALFRLGIPVGRLSASDLSTLFTGGVQAWARRGGESVPADTPPMLSKLAKLASWTKKRISNELSYAAYNDGRTKAVVAFVNPVDFIKATTPSSESFQRIYDEAGDLNLDELTQESQTPYLQVRGDRIVGHEGRHRMAALAKAGVTSVPVVLDYKEGEKRSAKAIRMLSGQSFANGTGERLFAEDLIPLTFDNRARIESLMENYRGGVMFSRTATQEVLYSRANDAVKEGLNKVTNTLRTLADPKAAGHDFWLQHADKILSVAPISRLNDIFGKAIPQIASVHKNLNMLQAVKAKISDDAYAIYRTALKVAGRHEGKLNQAMLDATFYQMIPGADKMDQDWVPKGTGMSETKRLAAARKAWNNAGMRTSTGKTFDEAYEAAQASYKQMVAANPKLQDHFWAVAKDLSDVRDRDKNNALAFIESIPEENKDLRDQLMAKFNESFNTIKGVYFPLTRYGDFILSFKNDQGQQITHHYETPHERRLAKDAFIKAGVPASAMSESKKNDTVKGEVVIPQALLQQITAVLEKKYLEGEDLSDEVAVLAAKERAASALAAVNQTIFRWLPDTAALKNSIHRKNTLGADTDMMRGYISYMLRHAGSIAWAEVGKQLEADIQSLADDNKALRDKGGEDTTMRDHHLNNLRKWFAAIKNEKVGAFTSTVGKISTGWYMTSPSTFIIQLTQLPALVLPNLATKFKSWPKAAMALKKGLVDAFSKKFSNDAIRGNARVNEVYDAIHRTVGYKDRPQGRMIGEPWHTPEEIATKIAGLSKQEKELLALREAEALNLLDISAVHEAMAAAKATQETVIGKAMMYAMLPMRHGELGSRKAAILATFRLAMSEGKDFYSALDMVDKVASETLFSFAKEDKGWLMQKDALRIPSTFQTYRINTALRIGTLFMQGLKGETPEVKAAARKEFNGILAMSAVLGGAKGMVLAPLLFGIANLIGGDDDEPYDAKRDVTNWLNENFNTFTANILDHGIFSVFGMNLSRRIGMESIYSPASEPPPGLHGAALAAWHAGNLIGPAFSVAQSWVKGYDQIANKGNYMKGLEDAMPKPLRDALKAYRIASEGLTDSQGRTLLDEAQIGADDIVMLALGFNPSEIAAAQTKSFDASKMSTQISERRGRLIKQASQAIVESGDTAEALAAIRVFNSKMPEFGISGRDIRPAVKKLMAGDLGLLGKRDRLIARRLGV